MANFQSLKDALKHFENKNYKKAIKVCNEGLEKDSFVSGILLVI